MERLTTMFCLSIVVLASPVVGQQPGTNESLTQGVAVIGDVERCQTIPVPAGTVLTVRDAAMKAIPLSESVNVTVIRSAQDRAQWTQFVSATSVDNGEPVESGDVLIVQSMSPLTTAVRKNAALRTDTGVFVISLEEDGIRIGDVLDQTHNLPLDDRQLKVICRFQGQTPISQPELHHTITHGDVISISHGGTSVLKGFGDMAPTVSEWRQATAAVLENSSIPNALPVDESPFTGSTGDSQAIQFPSSTAVPMLLPGEDVSTLREQNSADDTTADDNSFEKQTAEVPTLTISQSADVKDSAATDSSTRLVSEFSSVAPIAPEQMQMGAVSKTPAIAFNPWNLVFIGGLLLAGTLILAGTLKPEPDDNTEFSNAAARATDLIKNTNRQQISTVSGSTGDIATAVPKKVAQAISVATIPAAKATTIEAQLPTEAADVPAAPEALISSHEWFSGDWRGQAVSTQHVKEIASQTTFAAPEFVAEKASTTDAFSEIAAAATGIDRQNTKDASTSEATAVDTSSFPDLEDLLQNRLPIDLCETQLPLRVALFGKPAGPRRFRIDAAHTAVPTPHINSTVDNRREQPIAAASSASSHTQAPSTQQDAAASGSLDRALHFLQERTVS